MFISGKNCNERFDRKHKTQLMEQMPSPGRDNDFMNLNSI